MLTITSRRKQKTVCTLTQGTIIDARLAAAELIDCMPDGASSSYAFKWQYLKEEILSKYNEPNSGLSSDELRVAAFTKLLEGEHNNAKLNSADYVFTDTTQKVLSLAREEMRKIFGQFDLNVLKTSRFSSGASDHRSRRKGDPAYKFSRKGSLTVTPAAYKYAYSLITATPRWCVSGAWSQLQIVDGNVFDTVPKSNSTDRAIGKEPDMNMHMQLAIGTYLKHRLKTIAGVDLFDQTINQQLAHRGSVDGSVATLDFSNASNSISQRIVCELLAYCPEWLDLLFALRAPKACFSESDRKLFQLDSPTLNWHMFSSMGNGYTFELESAIFYSIAVAYCKLNSISTQDVNVYGDDLIVPTAACTEELFEVFTSCGFQINQNKSFWTGEFRESCGKHYHNGVDVSPFYIRKPIDSLPRLIWFANKIRQWSYDEKLHCCDPSTYRFWLKISRMIPTNLYGGYDCDSNESLVSAHARRQRLVPVTNRKDFKGANGYLRWLQFADYTAYKEYGLEPVVKPSFSLDEVLPSEVKHLKSRLLEGLSLECVGPSVIVEPVPLQFSMIDAHKYKQALLPTYVKRKGRLYKETPSVWLSSESWEQYPYYDKYYYSEEWAFIG